jgi:enamine deaminase RidA (YjgF/YER057c/UK114 family)
MIERIQFKDRPPSTKFSPVVRQGALLFVSGQVSRGADGKVVCPGDFTGQVEQTFKNLANVLAAADATLEHLLRITIYMTDPRYRDEWRRVKDRYIGKHLPASTMIFVAGLSEPEFLIEIDAIAAATL